MLLAIDSGNTNVVFALMDGRTVLAQWRIETNDRRTADEYFVWLSQLAAPACARPERCLRGYHCQRPSGEQLRVGTSGQGPFGLCPARGGQGNLPG